MSRSTDIVLFMSYLSDPFFICSLLLYFFQCQSGVAYKRFGYKKSGSPQNCLLHYENTITVTISKTANKGKNPYIDKIQIIVFFDVSYKSKHNKMKQSPIR